jgi:hypothetical protein
MYYLVPQFMTERHDAMNTITVDIPIEPLRKYMNEKRKEGHHISHMAILMTAYTHLVAEYPSLNRFVSNRRIYDHKDFKISLVVLRPGNTGNDDTMAKLEFSPQDTVFDVQKKLDDYIAENSAGAETNSNGLDNIMNKLCRLGGLLDVAGWLLRFMDRHGLLPKALVDVSPFHASALFTNLASIRTNHIYHHVYDFGTTSIAIAMGNMREIPKRGRDGQVELVRCMPLGIVMDERIASGHYFALAFARMKEMMTHPEQLEQPCTRTAALDAGKKL